MSPITEFYSGKTVFVTGATGYMGKVLLEKLVRSLPEIKKIYILIRAKKGFSPKERVKQLTDGVIFSFNNMHQRACEKIEAITGDITKDDFDMSESDKQKLINEVSIVFHVAASVRMDLGLKEAVITNTKSTYQLFKFCMNIKNLKSVVHLSTAFCNVEISYMEEKVYPLDVDPYKIMDLVEWMDEKCLSTITKKLLGPLPNTYIFTKRLAEMIAMDMGEKIPLIIARPSIVLPSVKEPIPGWVDNWNGPTGIFVAGGAGVMRTVLCDPKVSPELIPVDVAINSLIISAYERATVPYCNVPVINVTNGDYLRQTWGDIITNCRTVNKEYPFKYVLWNYGVTITQNYYVFILLTYLFHFIPAFVIDFLLIMFLQKPFLTSIQKRILMAVKVLKPFTLNEWMFVNKNFTELHRKLDKADNDRFYGIECDVEPMKMAYDAIRAAKIHLLKEGNPDKVDHTIYKIRDKILLGPHPNTYTFTKRLSEIIAKDMGDKLPLVITRPSIVVPALYEPVPGWVDSFYGPVGLCFAAGKGVLKIALVDPNILPQAIPVDAAINGLIVASYVRGTQQYSDTPVFNLTQGNLHQMRWGEFFDISLQLTYKYPFKKVLWYPRFSTTTSFALNTFYTYIYHFIPALFVDFLLIMFLQKPFLIEIQQRIYSASKLLYHFTVKEWEFSITNILQTNQKLTEEDQKAFYGVNGLELDFNKYFLDMFFFTRKYLFKDDVENVKFYRIRDKVLYVLDLFIKLMFYYWILKFIRMLILRFFY